jgi:hypothetical protein
MPSTQPVAENEVLLATALWLHSRRVLPLQFSVATGQRIDAEAAKEQIRAALTAAGVPAPLIRFASDGPDFLGISRGEWWQVECKGAGVGVQSTQRNNFDRGLASVVSYFGEPLPQLPEEFAALRSAAPHLGLALPATPDYLRELRRRVRQPLRRALNLWVLLYSTGSRAITAVGPESDYPSL